MAASGSNQSFAATWQADAQLLLVGATGKPHYLWIDRSLPKRRDTLLLADARQSLPYGCDDALNPFMNAFENEIAQTVARAPEWMRRDLLSQDRATRTRAEEAMAMLIAKRIEGVPKD